MNTMIESLELAYSPIPQTATRDNEWLADRLAEIWYRFFPDIEQPNEVIILFGRKSRTRLGSIGMEGWKSYTSSRAVAKGTSIITITGYFRDPAVPPYVIDATIGHELVHYAHGFHSPHPQRYKHPHKGNIVNKELYKRGMGEILRQQKSWLRQHWKGIAYEG